MNIILKYDATQNAKKPSQVFSYLSSEFSFHQICSFHFPNIFPQTLASASPNNNTLQIVKWIHTFYPIMIANAGERTQNNKVTKITVIP